MSDSIVFNRSKSGNFKLPHAVIMQLNSFRQVGINDFESGGILLGRYIKNSDDIVIDKITVPMPGDLCKRAYFYRQSMNHQAVIDYEWEKSDGTCNYLGEWHSHPQIKPIPSGLDIKNWERKMKYDSLPESFVFFLILGIKDIDIWEGRIKSLEFYKLEKRNHLNIDNFR